MQIQAYSKLQVEALLRHLLEYVATYGNLDGHSDETITKAWEIWSGDNIINSQLSFSDYLQSFSS